MVEHRLLGLERGVVVDAHALSLGAQQESVDAQEATEARESGRKLPKEGGCGGAQQDSWPIASSARQMQPSASNLDWYLLRALWMCCRHGVLVLLRVQSEIASPVQAK